MAQANKSKKSIREKPKNWFADRYESVIVQRNILLLIALISLLGTAISVFAVASLSGSKTIEPYVIEVEKKSGIVTTIARNSIEEYRANDVIKRYFLVLYLQAREGYDATDFQYNYSKVVRLMSSNTVYNQFRYQMLPENPDSPLNLQHGYKRIAKIKSISFLDADKKKAQIRMAIEELNESGQPIPNHRKNRIATIDFDFVDLKLTDEERMTVNPLGFQVQSYRVDNDVSEQ